MGELWRRGGWAYLAPYGLFLVIADLGSRLPDAWAGPMLVLRVALPGALLLGFAVRGHYGELRGYRLGPGTLADLAVGFGVAVLWVMPYSLFSGLPRPSVGTGFDAGVFGPAAAPLAVGLRVLGFALVTPFVEELFVRSFLIRYVEVYDSGADFREEPIGRYRARSFWVTVIWFTLTHLRWEWIVALPTAVVLNLWLYRRRHLGATVVAHAAANAAIALAVLIGPDSLAIFL